MVYTKKELEKLTVRGDHDNNLIMICEELGIPKKGLRADLIDAILKAQKEGKKKKKDESEESEEESSSEKKKKKKKPETKKKKKPVTESEESEESSSEKKKKKKKPETKKKKKPKKESEEESSSEKKKKKKKPVTESEESSSEKKKKDKKKKDKKKKDKSDSEDEWPESESDDKSKLSDKERAKLIYKQLKNKHGMTEKQFDVFFYGCLHNDPILINKDMNDEKIIKIIKPLMKEAEEDRESSSSRPKKPKKYSYDDLIKMRLSELKDLLEGDGFDVSNIKGSSKEQLATVFKNRKNKCDVDYSCEKGNVCDVSVKPAVCVPKDHGYDDTFEYKGKKIVGNSSAIEKIKKMLKKDSSEEEKGDFSTFKSSILELLENMDKKASLDMNAQVTLSNICIAFVKYVGRKLKDSAEKPKKALEEIYDNFSISDKMQEKMFKGDIEDAFISPQMVKSIIEQEVEGFNIIDKQLKYLTINLEYVIFKILSLARKKDKEITNDTLKSVLKKDEDLENIMNKIGYRLPEKYKEDDRLKGFTLNSEIDDQHRSALIKHKKYTCTEDDDFECGKDRFCDVSVSPGICVKEEDEVKYPSEYFYKGNKVVGTADAIQKLKIKIGQDLKERIVVIEKAKLSDPKLKTDALSTAEIKKKIEETEITEKPKKKDSSSSSKKKADSSSSPKEKKKKKQTKKKSSSSSSSSSVKEKKKNKDEESVPLTRKKKRQTEDVNDEIENAVLSCLGLTN